MAIDDKAAGSGLDCREINSIGIALAKDQISFSCLIDSIGISCVGTNEQVSEAIAKLAKSLENGYSRWDELSDEIDQVKEELER